MRLMSSQVFAVVLLLALQLPAYGAVSAAGSFGVAEFIGLILLVLVIKAVRDGASAPRLSYQEAIGREAEQQLAAILTRQLPEKFTHFQNLILKTAQGDLTEVDHLIISPYGVYVIEIKNYQGWIFGDTSSPQWTVRLFKKSFQFQNPLRQNYKHTEAVAHVLEIDGKYEPLKVQSIVAFNRTAEFKSKFPENVMYLDQVLHYIQIKAKVGRLIGDETLFKYRIRLNNIADKSEELKEQHRIQLEGQELMRDLNARRG